MWSSGGAKGPPEDAGRARCTGHGWVRYETYSYSSASEGNPPPDGAMLRPSTIGKLRVPSGAIRGTVEDVARVLPLLTELSVGARRGIPRWVPTAPVPPGLKSDDLTPRERSASWLEITYPFSTDDELRDKYMLGGDDSLRAGMFLEELDAFSADCSARHAGECPVGDAAFGLALSLPLQARISVGTCHCPTRR